MTLQKKINLKNYQKGSFNLFIGVVDIFLLSSFLCKQLIFQNVLPENKIANKLTIQQTKTAQKHAHWVGFFIASFSLL